MSEKGFNDDKSDEMEIYLMRKQITHLDETDTTTAGGAVTKNRSILRFSFIYFVFSFS